MLFPPLAALSGVTVVGALAAVGASAAFGALAGRAAGLLFVPAILATLVSGRLTFALGAAFGVAAVLAAARGRPWLAGLAAVLTALSSPVAALFAALAGAALLAGAPRARAGPVLVLAGALAPVLLLVWAFPEGGTFPFVASAFWPAFAFGIGVAVLAPPGPLRLGGVLYALLCLAAFVVPSPVGGNATRLGALVALPLAWLLVGPRSRVAAALLALPLAYWVAQPAVRDVLRAHDDPSVHAAFHAPLAGFLADRGPVRVEVPPTQNHGEANHLARHVAIARGWERQVDRDRNALFYTGRLTPERYRRWLDDNAVAYVALPLGVPLDAAGEAEARLVASGPDYLREAARLPGWRVFAVRDPRPLGVERLGAAGFDVRAVRTGRRTVRVRWTPYWAVVSGRGCVARAPGGWTEVRAEAPGRLEIRTRFAPGRVGADGPRCRNGGTGAG